MFKKRVKSKIELVRIILYSEKYYCIYTNVKCLAVCIFVLSQGNKFEEEMGWDNKSLVRVT